MKPNLLEYMKDHVLLLDGGMGTLLQAEGLGAGEKPETWNLTHPEVIVRLQKAYYDAGSHVVNTNTFGANLLHFTEEELESIIPAAVRCARQAAETSCGTQPRYVALDIGPSGRMLRPWGDLGFEEAVALFKKTVEIGVRAGVDLCMIETMNDALETKAALLAVRETCDLPVFVSNAYGADGKLMTGASPEAMVAMLEGMRADAIGVNCSLGPEALAPVVRRYLQTASVPVLLKPNAGLPRMEQGRTVYDVDADTFAAQTAELVREGVRVCGGCCGTTPEYLRALAEKVRGVSPVPCTCKHRTVVSSYTHAVTFDDPPVLIGERINPTGKKRFRQAIMEHDMNYILQEGLKQQDAGAQILDVNVGLPGIDEAAFLQETVEALQAVTDLPLQLDTADPAAMARAMRVYIGKPLVNSVSGKEEVMRAIFPLVRKYGGTVIALTLDDTGIPETAEGRLQIARHILSVAAEYGIGAEDIIVDPLAMTISADARSAMVTLEALSRIRTELGCHTSLGVSNVSFGLPGREGLHSVFFGLAAEHGLSAAIMNPLSYEMMRMFHVWRALHGKDPQCGAYIDYISTHAPQTTAAVAVTPGAEAQPAGALQTAVEKGLRDQAVQDTQSALRDRDGLTLIQEEIIPALNRVGERFEQKTLFLPQLLMSAEAASAAFEIIRAGMQKTPEASAARGVFVLATVHGDIHDIGKNIVRLLLESYGFEVHDLGKNVPAETISDAVVRLHAPMCGLSALMTTTVPAMEETIRLLRTAAPWCHVIVGGAVLTQKDAERIGADAYAKDAMAAVRWAEEETGRERGENV